MTRPSTKQMAAAVAVCALAVTGSLSTSAVAVEGTPQALDIAKAQTITVEGTEALTGHIFKAVSLATYSKAFGFTGADGRVTSFDVSTNPTLTKAINDSITAVDATSKVDDSANPMAWVVQNLLDSQSSPWAGKLRDFLDALKAQPAFTSESGTALTVDGTSASVSVTPGIYAIVDTTNAGGTPAAIIAMNGTGIDGLTKLQGTEEGAREYTLGTVEYKVHSVSIDKAIDKESAALDPHDAIAEAGNAASSMIGKTIPFKLTSTVPNWTGYSQYYYSISDSYSEGLDVDAGSVVVIVDGKTLTEGTDYTVTNTPASGDNKGTMQVLFGTKGNIIPGKDKFPVNTNVVITYNAKLNANALAGQPETNTAQVDYSHNPNDWTDHTTTPATEVKVYTGSVDIEKHDMDGKSLAGAEFQVNDATGDSTDTIAFVKVGDGSYRVAADTDKDTTETLVVSSDGKLRIDGIAKSFTLKETKSPFNGTYLPQATINAEVNPATGVVTATITTADSNKMVSAGQSGIVVQNARNLLEMPKTGATWMTIFATGVVLLLAAGVTLIVVARRKQSAN